MSAIDKDGIIIISLSLLLTILIIVCIKYFKCSNNDFSKISKTINQEKVQLI